VRARNISKLGAVQRAQPDESRRTSWIEADAAVVYDRGRPAYAPTAVDFALAPLAGRTDLRALDVGAGTGKLTAMLVATGLDTTAVEPAPGMRKMLRHRVPRARVLDGSAEQLPLPDGAVDVAVAGQAFHWFDQDRALPELARVLRPGGVLAVFYNSRDDAVAWVRALSELVGGPEGDDHVSVTSRHQPFELGPWFAFDDALQAPYEQELDVAGLVDLIASRSYVIRRPEAERAGLLARVEELARTHPELVGRQHFSMPYVTGVLRYRLRS
jgi:SAM-dependent methyltransferase